MNYQIDKLQVDDSKVISDPQEKKFINLDSTSRFVKYKDRYNTLPNSVVGLINFEIEENGVESIRRVHGVVSAAAYIGGLHRFLNFLTSWFVWLLVGKFFGLKAVIDVKSQLINNNEAYDEITKHKVE